MKKKAQTRWQKRPKVEMPREAWAIVAKLLEKSSPDEYREIDRHVYKIRNAAKPIDQ